MLGYRPSLFAGGRPFFEWIVGGLLVHETESEKHSHTDVEKSLLRGREGAEVTIYVRRDPFAAEGVGGGRYETVLLFAFRVAFPDSTT